LANSWGAIFLFVQTDYTSKIYPRFTQTLIPHVP